MKNFEKMINKIDYRDLNENATKLFEISDQGGLYAHFGKCTNVAEINETADELREEYPELFDYED